jgi:anti-sigma B factor antagonist
MDISISSRQSGDRVVVAVSGDVDVATAPELDARLVELVEAKQTRLVVDLSGVGFLDSSGLGVLIKALKRTREQDGSLDLVVTNDRILKVFRITGLDTVIPIHATLDGALA